MAVVLTTNTQPPAQSPVCGVVKAVKAVLISGETTTLTPSIGLSGGVGDMRRG